MIGAIGAMISFALEMIRGAIGLVLFAYVRTKVGHWMEDRLHYNGCEAAMATILGLLGFPVGAVLAVYILS
jgi:hypothetical protein